jgi:hypothetical protein
MSFQQFFEEHTGFEYSGDDTKRNHPKAWRHCHALWNQKCHQEYIDEENKIRDWVQTHARPFPQHGKP